MYYRTTYRLGDWIANIMSWVMGAKIRKFRLAHILLLIWIGIVSSRVPEVVGIVRKAMKTNEVASKKKHARRKHISFISEAVAQRFESPMQYPKH